MPTSLSAMLALFNDNTAGDISAADGRAVIQALHDWIPATERYKRGRLAGETAHADDDFFPSYTGYTEVTPTGTATWAQSLGGLGVKYISVADSDMAVAVKAMTATGPPVTLETAVSVFRAAGAYPGFALVFTAGTSSGSAMAGVGSIINGAPEINVFGGSPASVSRDTSGFFAIFDHASPIFMRIIWSAANTFKIQFSPDGGTWTSLSFSTYSRTLTPTHIGCGVTNWGLAREAAAVFHYLRVYEADLSL